MEALIPSFLPVTRIFNYWDRLRTSFWFLPSLMAGIAIIFSFALIELDSLLSAEMLDKAGWLYSFGPEGARAILSAIASSMITVAGLTFSITMLTLQLASSQFGPRLLRNFMGDRGNQVVLGTFVSTFLYCLLVLRTVRGTEGSSFVPHVSVAFGVLLAVASIAVLIYFIHHVANAIRIESLLESLAVEARATVDRLYPEPFGRSKPGDEPRECELPEKMSAKSRVCSGASGYVQHIDLGALMEIAIKNEFVISIAARPGSFITEADAIFYIQSSEDGVYDDATDLLRNTFVVGKERTPEQDLQFSIRRIVEIAQRALSPGINDPTTALYCIDRLGEVFRRLAKREMPSPFRYDETRRLRIVTDAFSFDDLACPAFAAVARYGRSDADVMAHLIRTMSEIGGAAQPGQCKEFLAVAENLALQAKREIFLEFDRRLAEQAPVRS